MKVLQINSVCGVGSTGRIATDIHNMLIEHGHESYIAFGRDQPKNCENTIRIGTKVDNYTHLAKTRILDKHGFGSKQATKEFIRKIIELNPDIIHLHNIHGYYLNIEILFNYLKEANKKVIWTLHDCWSFTGHCAYFDYVGCEKWKTGCYNCPEKNSYPSSMILDNSKGIYEKKREVFTGLKNLTIVSPSQWLANLVRESFLQEYTVKVINNGIDLNTFKPTKGIFREKYNLDDKFIILGVASVWDRRKGLKYFIELADTLTKNDVIVLVGLTEKQIKELPGNIIGINRTNNFEELVEIYSDADVFLNPTLEDNYPTTNLEAIACGTPVITFNTGGSPESISFDTGCVTDSKTIEGIQVAIKSMKQKQQSRIQVNVEKIDKLYNYNKYLKLYNELIGCDGESL